MSEYLPAEAFEPAAIHALIARCRRPDGSDALSEHKATRVGRTGEVYEVVGVNALGALESYAQAAWHGLAGSPVSGHWAVEVATDPGSPTRPDVVGLIGSLRKRLPSARRVAVWAFSEPVANDLAAGGYEETRRLLRLEAQLPLGATASLPGQVRLERFVSGRDDAAWLRLNNTAFAGHPENGSLAHDDLAERLRHDWFDAEGFFMAWDGPRLVGSCWTKLHNGGVGEIYIIAVHPDEQGRGIGRALVVSGAGYLEGVRGADRLMLYVEGDNETALRLYRTLGFEVGAVNRQMELMKTDEAQPNR